MDSPPAAPTTPLRVVLVDDHEVVRSGLRSLIEATPDIVVVGEAATATEGIEQVGEGGPDVVVLDLRLPDFSGIEACQVITDRFPGVGVLILTSFADESAQRTALVAGASGYVLKQISAFDLVSAIKRVAAGEKVFGPGLGPLPNTDSEPDRLLSRLSPQERVIAKYIADGLTNREIAEEMFLAEKTVKNYVSHLLTKMGFHRRTEAAAYVARLEAERERWMRKPELNHR